MVIDLYLCRKKIILVNCTTLVSLVYNCTERYKSNVLYIMTIIIMIIVMAILLLLLLVIIIKKKLNPMAEGETTYKVLKVTEMSEF